MPKFVSTLLEILPLRIIDAELDTVTDHVSTLLEILRGGYVGYAEANFSK